MPTATAYPDTFFAATHNSYSGGNRGTYTQQLDGGVRFLELDINVSKFSQVHDYLVGHGSPGRQVDHDPGNPSTNDMTAWLQLVANWSRSNPGHAPITMGIDVKNNLASIDSAADGNIGALNTLVAQSFGDLLYTSEELTRDGNSWPTWQDLSGRVLMVLSGNETTRKAYLSDQGETPAVALSGTGWVVEVHKSQSNSNLWYWAGFLQDDGSVDWTRHGKYDKGNEPAVAVNTAGVVVEVHKSQSHDKLYYHVGQVTTDGDITWGPSHEFASGESPSVRFDDATELLVTEIHRDGNSTKRMTGTVDPSTQTIAWGPAESTSEAPFPTAVATAGGQTITVATGSDPVDDTLIYSTNQFSGARIRYHQTFFVEYQKGNGSQLADAGLWFYAASAGGNVDWGEEQRQAGKVVRLWGFDNGDAAGNPRINFAATDTPNESWYRNYEATIGAVD